MKLVYTKTINFELCDAKENFYILYRVDASKTPLVENNEFDVIETTKIPVATVSSYFDDDVKETLYRCISIGLFAKNISTVHSDIKEVTKQWVAEYSYYMHEAGKFEVEIV